MYKNILKQDVMKEIKTLNYGFLRVTMDKKELQGEVEDIIECDNGLVFDVRLTEQGEKICYMDKEEFMWFNRKPILLRLMEVLDTLGFGSATYAKQDIENQRSDRAIHLLDDKEFEMIYRNNVVELHTMNSGICVTSSFVKTATLLRSLTDATNEKLKELEV